MIELLTTRHNPLVDPTLHVWDWQIPVYLFLGGWVAGSMVLTGYLQRQARAPGQTTVSDRLPWVGLLLISLGMGALFLDLEHKLYVWRMYLTLQPLSPMSWGGWILLLVYPVLALGALATLAARLRELELPLLDLELRLPGPGGVELVARARRGSRRRRLI